MKKAIISFVLILVLVLGGVPAASVKVHAADDVAINKTNFPDATFRAYVSETFDADRNGYLSTDEIQNAECIDVCYSEITKLKGIEYFTELIDLECYNNALTSLDVSKNTKLEILSCSHNQLTSLNVSKNTELYYIDCSSNQITSLDVTRNTGLVALFCDDNQLTSLNVTKNLALVELGCSRNALTSLKVTNNTGLQFLYCYRNQLTSLNISKCLELSILYCHENQLTSLDVSKNEKLKTLACSKNALTSLDVSNNPILEYLNCYQNQITSLDVSRNTALNYLACSENKLTGLNVSKNTALEMLYCGENQLGSINVTKNTKLYYFACQNAGLTSLDVSKNTLLENLYCYQNNLSEINISNNPYLIQAYKAARETEEFYKYKYEEGETYYVFWVDINCSVFTATPKVTTQPTDQYAALGDTVKFTVKANEAVTYQWYYRTSENGTWTAVSSSAGKKATYSFTAAARHNGYQYRCKMTNPVGYKYTVVRTLTIVTEKPSITTQPKNQTVAAGDKAEFTVKASGDALSYQWYYRTSEEGTWTKVSASSGKTASFSLTAAARHNGYQYRCKVSNPAGYRYTSTRTLTVVSEKPAITTQPSDKTVKEGETATFKVKASGEGLTYQWYYRKSSSSSWTLVSAASGKTANFSLTAQARHNGYQYRCKVTNSLGSATTQTVTLTVN